MRLKILDAVLAVLFLLYVAGYLFAETPSIPYGETLASHPRIVAMHNACNAVRTRYGKAPLALSRELVHACQDHSNWQAANQNMSHYANGGYVNRARRWGFRGFVQENIAYGQTSVDSVMRTWENSPGHMAAIISSTTHAGFGAQQDSRGVWWWTMCVGTSEVKP